MTSNRGNLKRVISLSTFVVEIRTSVNQLQWQSEKASTLSRTISGSQRGVREQRCRVVREEVIVPSNLRLNIEVISSIFNGHYLNQIAAVLALSRTWRFAQSVPFAADRTVPDSN